MAKDKQPEPKKPLQVTPAPAKPVSIPDKPMKSSVAKNTEPLVEVQESQARFKKMDAAFGKMSARGTPDEPMKSRVAKDTEPLVEVQESQARFRKMDAAFGKMSARGTPDAATTLSVQKESAPMAAVAPKGRVAEVKADAARSTATKRPATPLRESDAAFRAGAAAAGRRLDADTPSNIGAQRAETRPMSPPKRS